MFGNKRDMKILQKEMDKYTKKMQKLNRQIDGFNMEVKLKATELQKIRRCFHD